MTINVKGWIPLKPLTDEQRDILGETLTRIGFIKKRQPGQRKQHFYQTTHHITYHGVDYLIHFKHGKAVLKKRNPRLSREERERLKQVADTLHKWGLLQLAKPVQYEYRYLPMLKFAEKANYVLKSNLSEKDQEKLHEICKAH